MKMVFSGFMAAAKEDRVAREEKEYENSVRESERKARLEEARVQREFQAGENALNRNASSAESALGRTHSERLANLGYQNGLNLDSIRRLRDQEEKDLGFKRDVDGVMELYGFDPTLRSGVAAGIESFGKDVFIQKYDAGAYTIQMPQTTNAPQTPNNVIARGNDALVQQGMDVMAVKPKVQFDFTSIGPNRPEKPNQEIMNAIGYATQEVFGEGSTVRIISGKGEYGSARHRDGHAADVEILDAQGNLIGLDDPRAVQLAERVKAYGITGFGAGEEYMGHNRFHLDNYPLENYTADMGQTWGSFGAKVASAVVNGDGEGPKLVYDPKAGRTAPDWFLEGIAGASTPEKVIALNGRVSSLPDSDPLKPFYTSQLENQQTVLEARERAKAIVDSSDNESFSEQMSGLNGIGDAIALEFGIKTDKNLSLEEKSERLSILQDYRSAEQQREVNDAQMKGDTIGFIKFGANGELNTTDQILVKAGPKGFTDINTGEVIDANSGVPITEGVDTDFLKLHNSSIRETVAIMESANRATAALLEFRRVGIENPGARNKYSRMLGGVDDTLSSVYSAIDGMTGEYEFERIGGLLENVTNMSAGDREFLNKGFAAAYAMAAARGSTGMALSDKEFAGNLQTLGLDEADGNRFVNTVNGMVQDVVAGATVSVQTRIDGMAGSKFAKQQFVEGTLFGTPPVEYIGQQLQAIDEIKPGTYQAYQDALAGKVDYFAEPRRVMDEVSPTAAQVNPSFDSAIGMDAPEVKQAEAISNDLSQGQSAPNTPQQAREEVTVDFTPVVVSKAMAAQNENLKDFIGEEVIFHEFADGTVEIEVVQ